MRSWWVIGQRGSRQGRGFNQSIEARQSVRRPRHARTIIWLLINRARMEAQSRPDPVSSTLPRRCPLPKGGAGPSSPAVGVGGWSIGATTPRHSKPATWTLRFGEMARNSVQSIDRLACRPAIKSRQTKDRRRSCGYGWVEERRPGPRTRSRSRAEWADDRWEAGAQHGHGSPPT